MSLFELFYFILASNFILTSLLLSDKHEMPSGIFFSLPDFFRAQAVLQLGVAKHSDPSVLVVFVDFLLVFGVRWFAFLVSL